MHATSPGFLREAYEFIESLNRQSTTDGVINVLQRALARLGFEFFCLATLPDPIQRFEEMMLAASAPEEYLKLYADRQYVQIDPTIPHFKRTNSPFRWQDVPFDREREPRVIEFIERRADFGMLNGLWFPIPGPEGCIGGVWIGGRAVELIGGDLSILHFMTLSAFDRLLRLRELTSSGAKALTNREREVLTWVAAGKSAWEIGEILNISERTAHAHISNAREKLGAVNRTQAVMIALRDRIIKP